MNVITAHGTVHHITAGVSYKSRGYAYTNVAGVAWGKADCGALVSTAGEHTDAELTCAKCAARAVVEAVEVEAPAAAAAEVEVPAAAEAPRTAAQIRRDLDELGRSFVRLDEAVASGAVTVDEFHAQRAAMWVRRIELQREFHAAMAASRAAYAAAMYEALAEEAGCNADGHDLDAEGECRNCFQRVEVEVAPVVEVAPEHGPFDHTTVSYAFGRRQTIASTRQECTVCGGGREHR